MTDCKRLTIKPLTLGPLDLHDANFTRECVQPIDDAREAKISYQVNAIIERSNLRVRFLPGVFGKSQQDRPHFASFGWT